MASKSDLVRWAADITGYLYHNSCSRFNILIAFVVCYDDWAMERVYDAIIIGSGPAGLTAGIYLARANLKTVIIAGSRWGGQLMLTTLVENFPGFPNGIQGPELMANMRKQAENMGAEIMDVDVVELNFKNGIFEIKSSNQTMAKAKAVLIATGALTKWLGIPGEDKLIGRGVSTCAPCDAAFFKNKKVIVVGGGDAAMEEALVLTKFSSEVTIVHRKSEFRASKVMQERVLNNPKIKVKWETEIKEIIGELKVEKVRFGTGEEMQVDGVFVAIGHMPASELFKGQVETDEKGYIQRSNNPKIQYSAMTNLPGVFVAGDVHDHKYKQAITAAGYGCEAALEIEKYLDELADITPLC